MEQHSIIVTSTDNNKVGISNTSAHFVGNGDPNSRKISRPSSVIPLPSRRLASTATPTSAVIMYHNNLAGSVSLHNTPRATPIPLSLASPHPHNPRLVPQSGRMSADFLSDGTPVGKPALPDGYGGLYVRKQPVLAGLEPVPTGLNSVPTGPNPVPTGLNPVLLPGSQQPPAFERVSVSPSAKKTPLHYKHPSSSTGQREEVMMDSWWRWWLVGFGSLYRARQKVFPRFREYPQGPVGNHAT